MKTIEIEIAMMKKLDYTRNIIVPNIWWGIDGIHHECDLLSLSPANYATEIEIKITKNDLLKDREKRHLHLSKKIKRFYFAVPEKLKDIALIEIPERAGLYVIHNKKTTYWSIKKGYYESEHYIVEKIRECKKNKIAIKWTDKERLKLLELGIMRIFGLKQKLLKFMK